nr:MAG: replication associated protein [Cressdnaviricota sp.]
MQQRSRNFCVTHNNWTPDHLVLYKHLPTQYIVIGKEKGASGTPHLQITMVFANAKTLGAAIKGMPPGNPHVEICKDLQASIDYCMKDGDFLEQGTRPLKAEDKGKLEQDRWKDALIKAREGRFDELPPKMQFMQFPLLERIRNNHLKNLKGLQDTTEQMLWFFGPSRTGKSRLAREKYPKAFLKMCNKWCDGYTNQQVWIIEDFDIKHDVLCHHLKIWGDRYPFQGEYKGGAMMMRPKLIIVTSNYHPQQIWQSRSDWEPILERYKCIEFSQKPQQTPFFVDGLTSQQSHLKVTSNWDESFELEYKDTTDEEHSNQQLATASSVVLSDTDDEEEEDDEIQFVQPARPMPGGPVELTRSKAFTVSQTKKLKEIIAQEGTHEEEERSSQ